MFVVQGRASVLGKQPCPYHWVAADDLACMVATAYGRVEAANKRFIVHGPEAIQVHEALRRYCAVFHPDIKQVSTMPIWLVKILATISGNQDLKFAGEMMSYFEKVGEPSSPAETNGVLGMPAMTLDQWLQARKARFSAGHAGRSPKER